MQEVKPIMPIAVEGPSEAPTPLALEEVEKMIQNAKDDVIRQANAKINEQMQKAQDSFITIFGIFSSVLSFLSHRISIFKNTLSYWTSDWIFTLVSCIITQLQPGIRLHGDKKIQSRTSGAKLCNSIDSGHIWRGIVHALVYTLERQLAQQNIIVFHNHHI